MNLDPYKDGAKILSVEEGSGVAKAAPEISIVVPVFNLSRYIKETLDSIFCQGFHDYEVILVNDGSNDTKELEEAIRPYRDKLIYILQENAGAAVARNTAILHARGKYIAFLDGDDIWLPEYLEEQLEFIRENSLELAYCNAEYCGEKIYEKPTYMDNTPTDGKITAEKLLLGSASFITSGTMVLREKLLENGLFDKRFPRNEDYDLWFRLVRAGLKADYQEKVLLKYRIRFGSLSGNNVDRAERLLYAYELIKEKYQLTKSESEVIEFRLRVAKADLNLEKAKAFLVKEDFASAREYIRRANVFHKKAKFSFLTISLILSPRFILKLFKILRKREYLLISS